MTIEGKVAQVISERDLAINRGSEDGVHAGMRFKILGPEPAEVRDPDTDEVLGMVEIAKVEVEAVTVFEKFTVCRTFKTVTVPGRPAQPGLSSAYSGLSRSIFGEPGAPARTRYQTLRSDEDFVIDELDPNGSFVKRGDRAVQSVEQAKYSDER